MKNPALIALVAASLAVAGVGWGRIADHAAWPTAARRVSWLDAGGRPFDRESFSCHGDIHFATLLDGERLWVMCTPMRAFPNGALGLFDLTRGEGRIVAPFPDGMRLEWSETLHSNPDHSLSIAVHTAAGTMEGVAGPAGWIRPPGPQKDAKPAIDFAPEDTIAIPLGAPAPPAPAELPRGFFMSTLFTVDGGHPSRQARWYEDGKFALRLPDRVVLMSTDTSNHREWYTLEIGGRVVARVDDCSSLANGRFVPRSGGSWLVNEEGCYLALDGELQRADPRSVVEHIRMRGSGYSSWNEGWRVALVGWALLNPLVLLIPGVRRRIWPGAIWVAGAAIALASQWRVLG